ncbi:hypothetical protein KSP40_PGU022328 [Platanthera guangdongensis]|uniref:Glutamate-rich WD repeat-containing protein 1 n=1 Tax=Platanthera guangdongensis TaxID=2320717 RepID=A0ABR2MDM8_9ASPA
MVRSIKNLKKTERKIKESKKRDSSYFSKVPYAPAKVVWEPWVDELEEGEELQFDPSTYNYLQKFRTGSSCLSFDIIHDSLGLVRSEFPHTLFGIVGTQAPSRHKRNLEPRRKAQDAEACLRKAKKASLNYIGIFKISNISGKKHDLLPYATDDEDVDIDSESGSDEDDVNSEPIFQFFEIPHQGCVNRIRAMSQKPYICATWAERGHVQVWDFTSQLNTLMESEAQSCHGGNTINVVAPLFNFDGHKDEGFAMDWNPVVPGRLISGDRNSCIHLWEPSSDSWIVDRNPFVGHKASVEDLQWSPTEENVFASCSVDGNISLWDTRIGKSPTVFLKAHNTDVNAISWNRLESFMIVSGSDDGAFSIWDLRLIKEDSRVAHFECHKQPITSIEWCPHEASTLAVSSADDQLTIWDLSLERDEEGEAEFKARFKEQATASQHLPPQLLFVHHSQKDIKELHWHPQIPGMILSGDIDGLDILMPFNVLSTLSRRHI